MKCKNERKNQFLFIIFKSFTYDLLFYYSLETMFLTLVKGFSFSQVFLISSIDLFFVTILSLPLNLLLSKIPVLQRLRLGTISFIIYMFAFIFINNIYILMFFSLFKSIGNLVVSIGTTELLKNLCNDNEKNKASKIEGRATASWWILEAISAIVSGYLFQINYYISYYINIGLLFIAFLTTFFFNVKNENKTDNLQTETVVENKNVNKKEYIKNMLIFVFIAFAFWGAAEVFGSSAKTFFQEIGTTSVLIGWIYFAVKIITATCNFFSYRLERKLGYRFLPAVILAFLSSVLLMVTIYFIETTFVVKLILIIVSLVFMYITRNHYRLNIKNTMVNIYEKKQIGKVYSYYFMSENLGGVVFSLIASITIDKLDLGWSMMINLIIIALMLIPLLIIYSKTFKTQYKNNLINKGSLTGLNDEANSADRENSQNIK